MDLSTEFNESYNGSLAIDKDIISSMARTAQSDNPWLKLNLDGGYMISSVMLYTTYYGNTIYISTLLYLLVDVEFWYI